MDIKKFFACENYTHLLNIVTNAFIPNTASSFLILICKYKQMDFCVKIVSEKWHEEEHYKCSRNHPSKCSSYNKNEIQFLKLLRKNIIREGLTPHIIEYLYHSRCAIKIYEDFLPKVYRTELLNKPTAGKSVIDTVNTAMSYIINSYKAKILKPHIYYIVMEYCNISFYNYFNTLGQNYISIIIMKGVLFQILFTLLQIRTKYPEFVHNDLHVDNIMFTLHYDFKFNINKLSYTKYTYNNTVFYIPYFGIIPKIIDFGLSYYDKQTYDNIMTNSLKFTRGKNDMLFLMANIYKTFPMVETFFNRIDPKGIYKYDYRSEVAEHEISVPDINEMITLDCWDEFKNIESENIIDYFPK